MKWYLVDTTESKFEITPNSSDLKVIFFVKGKNGKAIKYDFLDVTSSNENVASVYWDQKSGGKYYILTVVPGSLLGTAHMTIKATEYKGTEDVVTEYGFDVSSKDFNDDINSLKLSASTISLNNSPYAPTAEVKAEAVNSNGEPVDATWDIAVYYKGKETSDVKASWTQKGEDEVLTIDALGAAGGTDSVSLTATGTCGNDLKPIKKSITVRVTDVISSVYPDGWTVKGQTIAVKGNVANEISATYKVETEDLYITDYKGSRLSTEVKLAVYVNGKPLGYLNAGGVDGFDCGWEIGAKALCSSGVCSGDWNKVNFDLLNTYVYKGSSYYTVVKDGTLYLGQDQKNEFTTKDKLTKTIKAGNTVSLLSTSKDKENEICYYGKDSNKNNIAAEGRYFAVIKYGNNFDDGKQVGNTAGINVSYDLTMPTVEYNASESAENYAVADVDLVRADDGYSVSYCANNGATAIRFPDYTFGKNKLSKGNKVYAVQVDDVRGGNFGDGAEHAHPGWFSQYPGAEDMKNKYSFDGGQNEDGVLIHFIIEKVTKITA